MSNILLIVIKGGLILFNKKILIFLLLLVGILTISAVSANEIVNESDTQLSIDENIIEADCQNDESCDDNAVLKENGEEYDEDYYPGFEYSNYYDDAYVNLTLPKNAQGNMVVLLIEYNDDYEEIYTEIGNVELVNGKASFKLPCLEFISYEYMAEYTGSDYEVEPVYKDISIVPKVIFSPKVWIGEDNYISFRMPDGEELKAMLYRNYDLVAETVIQDGSKIKLTDLSNGYNNYYLEYYTLDEDWFSSSEFYMQVMENSPDFKLNVTVSEEVAGSHYPNVLIELPGDHEYFEDMITVIVDGDESNAIKTDSCDFYIPSDNLTMGTHTLEVICKADDYYKQSRVLTTFNLSYIAVNVDERYDYASLMWFELIENATGYLELYIDGKIYDLRFADDKYFALNNVTMGRHSYEIRYSGDKNYPPYSKKGTFVMDYDLVLDSYIFLPYGDDNQIEVYSDSPLCGNVIFSVDGKNYTDNIDDGSAVLKLPKLPAGTYPLTVTYPGDEIFTPKTLHSEIEIDYAIIIGEDNVKLTLPSDAQGDLVVFVYDQDENLLNEYSQTLINGKSIISLSDLDYGEYNVEAQYTGEDYIISSPSAPVWIEDPCRNIKIIWPEDITLYKDSYIAFDLPDKCDKSRLKVTFLDDDESVINYTTGQTRIKIPTSELKSYHLMVYYGENYLDDFYLDVKPLKVDVPDNNGDLKLGDIISVEMPENAKGKIILTFNDYLTGNFEKRFESGPSVAGKTSIVVNNLTSKLYSMNVGYVDEVYGNYSLGLRVQITGQGSDFKLTALNEMNSTTFNLNLNEDAGGEAVLLINNQTYYSIVKDGAAEFEVPKSSLKIADVCVYYSGDEKYAKFTKNTAVEIKSVPVIYASGVKAAYNVAKNLIITLKDENGALLSGKVISVELNGKTYNRTTDSKGRVSLSIPTNLVPKTYNAKITFAGDDSYILKDKLVKINVVKASVKLTAKKASFKVKTKTKKYFVTLKNNKNKAMKNIKVTLKVKGKTYTAKTNSKGSAIFKITKLTKKGTFSAVVKFAANKYYNGASKAIKLTVR